MDTDTSRDSETSEIKAMLADEAHDGDHLDEWRWLFHEDPEVRRLAKERTDRCWRRLGEKLREQGLLPDEKPPD